MLNQQDQLTELVRILEEKQHVFSADPLLITEKLKKESGTPLQKLHWRAKRIDSNGNLAHTLQKIDFRIKGIILVLSIAWCVSGFLGLFALLQSQVVNFFYVLVCLLGFHTVMLVGWLVMTLINARGNKASLLGHFVIPSYLIRGKDDVTQSAVQLYEKQLQHTGMTWYLGKISHQLWLATLTGMLFAIIFLLIVRQYTFSWESTLLSDGALVTLTDWLGWLPSKVGFSVPDAHAISESRHIQTDMPLNIARQWASLLIGSLLMYGIVPRAIAWAICSLMFMRKKMRLDLKLPYYQKIVQFWQTDVIDEDDFDEVIKPVAPKAEFITGKKLVALLEYQHPDEYWYQFTAGHDIEDFGILDDRDDLERLLDHLQTHDVQVLLGVQQHALPDRGTLRKLEKIAQSAKHGLIVQLLQADDELNEIFEPNHNDAQNSHAKHSNAQIRKEQWEEALAARNIAMVKN